MRGFDEVCYSVFRHCVTTAFKVAGVRSLSKIIQALISVMRRERERKKRFFNENVTSLIKLRLCRKKRLEKQNKLLIKQIHLDLMTPMNSAHVNFITLHFARITVYIINTLHNGTTHLKKCKQLLEYQHLLLLRDIWWSKF